MTPDEMHAKRARDRAFHELRVYVTQTSYGNERSVRVWHKPLGRDWQTQDFMYKASYARLGEYGDPAWLVSAAISALEELEEKLLEGEF
uniref:Uncharacterized protein n=1 Tax=uncultured prokaryote TaxID=198431 RepID=A0A0H5Q6F1_9ZZZZ|nr:hypothetical protein [uncultured prokaryote]